MTLDVRADRAGQVAPAGTRRAHYLPVAEHGLIGDLHTVALVGTDGTIDCYCCPRFDSPSVFGSILDADRGGLFRIAPEGEGWSSKQLYLPDTNVLGGVLAAVAGSRALQRALARDGASRGADAQAAHLRAHRCDRGRPTASRSWPRGGVRPNSACSASSSS